MFLSEQELENLAEKRLQGTISPEESKLLDDWLQSNNANNMVWIGDKNEELLRNRILQRIRLDTGIVKPRATYMRPYMWAAAIFTLILIGSYFVFKGSMNFKENKIIAKDIPPGGNGAILTLGNGKQITLGDNKTFSAISFPGITQENGTLTFHPNSDDSSSLTYNTINTVRGKQYHIALPDGTKVWLNSASEIYFPSAFIGRERRVSIKGEAYFEVTKNPLQPFVVSAGNMKVTVLGTHFGVNAYEDEAKITTTLLEGAVSISNHFDKKNIHPGQQAIISGNSPIKVNSVDTSEAVAWVHGKLSLDVQDVSALMRQIARWYDIEVQYRTPPKAIGITGLVNRNVYLTNLLQALSSYGIKAHLEGRIVIVD